MPSADFCRAVIRPYERVSPGRHARDTRQTSRGKFDLLRHTPAGFTIGSFDGLDFVDPCRLVPTRSPHSRFLFIGP
jgi:hypothetical protein